MTHRFDGRNYIVVLKKNEELLEQLTAFVKEVELEQAVISGLGGAQYAELGFYNLKTKQYQWRSIDKLCELASLQGNVVHDQEGEPVFHLHGVLADENYQALGGHIRKLTVGGTCELFIQPYAELQPYAEQITRRTDPETGLNLLHL